MEKITLDLLICVYQDLRELVVTEKVFPQTYFHFVTFAFVTISRQITENNNYAQVSLNLSKLIR